MYHPCILTSSMSILSHKITPHGWHPCGVCVEYMCSLFDWNFIKRESHDAYSAIKSYLGVPDMVFPLHA